MVKYVRGMLQALVLCTTVNQKMYMIKCCRDGHFVNELSIKVCTWNVASTRSAYGQSVQNRMLQKLNVEYTCQSKCNDANFVNKLSSVRVYVECCKHCVQLSLSQML